MQSPPTLPRRRGRLQPDPKCCGPGSDGLTAESNANMGGRSFARPGGEALRRGGTLPVAVRQLLFLDCEDRALLHLDVAHDANAADLVAELHIVACIDCASEKDLTPVRDGRYSAPCRNSWRHRVRSAQSAWLKRGPLH